jgi:hypothetical protein
VRFLPYALVLACAAPIIAWFLVNLAVKGTANTFGGMDTTVLVTLGVCTLAAFGLLARWMDKYIQRTR